MEDVWSQGDWTEDAMSEGRKRMIAATIEKFEQYGTLGTLDT